jgi:Dockerin type I domain/IPT/TIG domain/Calx-beta domain
MRLKLYLIIVILFFGYANAQKQCNIYEVSLDERLQNSSLVVEGIVKSQHAKWDNFNRNIYTIYEVEVLGVLKGTTFDSTVLVACPGGTLGLTRHEFSQTLKLEEGNTGIFMLMPNKFGVIDSKEVYQTSALSQGFIRYEPETKKAKGVFEDYPSIENDLYPAIQQKTNQRIQRKSNINWKNVKSRYLSIEDHSTHEHTQRGILATISSFSPTTVQAGRNTQLTISGTGFGTSQGTSYVAFKNADDGGSTYTSCYANQYVSWSDTQIVVKVPSSAGTGTIRVNIGGTNTTSSGTLTVEYAISALEYTYNSITSEYNGKLISNNSLGGYTFKYTSDVITNGKTYFETAVKDWRCNSGVHFLISSTASSLTATADDSENTVDYVAYGTGTGVIAQAISRFSGCVSGSDVAWNVGDIDIEVNSSLSYYYGTGTPGGTQYDYYTAVLHELGHANQLGHIIDTATTPTKIMHYSLGTGVSRRTIDTGASTGGIYWVGQSIASSNCSATKHSTMNCTSTVTLQVNNATSATVSENVGTVTLKATQNQLNYSDVVVNFSYSGTATSGSDYTNVGSITIPAGSLSATTTLSITNDSVYEGSTNETIILDISSVSNATESGTQQVTVSITDNETAPTVTMSVDINSFTEGTGTNRTLTFTLSSASATATTINLAYTGTATNGTDYSANTTATISAGATSTTLIITNIEDSLYEGTETVIVDISSVTNATENGNQQVTINFYDSDTAPSVTLSATPTSIAEASGSATITATLSAASGLATTVTLTISGTAESTDYSQATSIVIPAGSTTASITCTAIQDTVDEVNETIISDITAVTNATESGTQKVTITINDDDASPTITISSSVTSMSENGGLATITATSSAISEQDITVLYSILGTATSNTDYSTTGNFILITAGLTSSNSNVVFNAIDDTLDETNETIIVDVSSVTNGTESGTQQKTITITDDDATPTVTLSSGATSISETSGTTTITATLSAASGQAVTVNLGLTGTATTSTDYTLTTSISIPAGSITGNITLSSVSDTLDEANETVIIDISSVTNATESGSQQVTVTINDDDATPTVTLSAGATTIAETSGTTTVTATLSAVSGQVVTVNLGLTGTATTTTDYTLATSISIPSGSTSVSITLNTVSDALDETDETVIIDITSVSNATESGTQQKTVTITDDDVTPTVTIAWSNTSIGEGPAGTSNAVATLSAISGQTVTLNLTWSGNAALNTDYTVTGSVITIPAGSLTGFVTMNNIADTIDEGSSENIGVTISSATNATIGNPSLAFMTQNDDDAVPTVTLSVSPNSIVETTSNTSTITATLSNASYLATTVTIALSGTAISNTDYSIPTLTITIPAFSLTGTTIVTPISDIIYEGNETVIVDVNSVTNGTENGIQQQTITITDDEAVPTVSVIPDTSSFFENNSTTITAQLSSIASSNITVNLNYSGTAISGADYSSSNSITIPAGSTTGFISLLGIDDAIHEGSETINVGITSANIATFNTNTASIELKDNDNPPNITLTTDVTSITEGSGTTATITATASEISGLDTIVDLDFVGDAILNSDYTFDTTITIPAGQLSASKTFTVIDDNEVENTENASILISNITNGNEFNNEQVNITLIDNDILSTTLNLKLFFEGYYNLSTHKMTPAKYNQGGTTDTDIVDDIIVELRNTNNGDLVVSTTATLEIDGNATAQFNSAYSGSYFIVVKHRNGLETWSATSQTIAGVSFTYDFTTAANNAYGSNQVMLESGVYGIYSGDVNQDGFIDSLDITPISNDSDNFEEGFKSTDINGDGYVDSLDLPIVTNNADNFIEALKPYSTSRRRK